MVNTIALVLSFMVGGATAMGCFYLGYTFSLENKKPKRKPRAKKVKCDVIDLEELFEKSSKSA